ncbi:MAG: hypothetical protein WD052_04410 [Bacteroidales bacterium]
MTRKEFISTITRGTVLMAMAAMVGLFVARKKISLQANCTLNGQCKGCGILTSCALPQAKKELENGKG